MKKISVLFLCVLVSVIFLTIVGNNSLDKESDYEDSTGWPPYYQNLAEECKYRSSFNCCISSVRYMMQNSLFAPGSQECKPGFEKNTLKCIDSFSWCQASSDCEDEDWSCLCARIDGAGGCNESFECTWTDYHSNEFYCMEQFCMDYSEIECAKHPRCIWLFDKDGKYEYCESRKYFDPERHATLD